ncbi:hypothetical protein A6302_01319 [Methylobrevis pamukkalensis]|uniref:Uncharacterized protein n=1 Tax=Methylobrevis pamukkalensis TaxID=1439726 RepID=A0A1E3H4V2_9HYPH|nr:hypothetical protein A6302_01319 [Methylobrevis pamukkalensis]
MAVFGRILQTVESGDLVTGKIGPRAVAKRLVDQRLDRRGVDRGLDRPRLDVESLRRNRTAQQCGHRERREAARHPCPRHHCALTRLSQHRSPCPSFRRQFAALPCALRSLPGRPRRSASGCSCTKPSCTRHARARAGRTASDCRRARNKRPKWVNFGFAHGETKSAVIDHVPATCRNGKIPRPMAGKMTGHFGSSWTVRNTSRTRIAKAAPTAGRGRNAPCRFDLRRDAKYFAQSVSSNVDGIFRRISETPWKQRPGIPPSNLASHAGSANVCAPSVRRPQALSGLWLNSGDLPPPAGAVAFIFHDVAESSQEIRQAHLSDYVETR